jgi:hypothetical protein
MNRLISLYCVLTVSISFGQVFNYGHKDLAFKNLLENGICFLKTGNAEFDSTMLEALEKYWTITEFTSVERYKHPPKETTAFFVTTKTKTKKHVMDRKNQHVLVLQPAKLWKKDKQVPFDQTLGYMYFNGFYEVLEEEDEHLFSRYLVQSLNKGLSIIKEKKFHNANQDLNEKIAAELTSRAKGLLGNTLILNREFLVHFIDIEKVKKYKITHRLHAKEEFFQSLNTNARTHYFLYYSVNTRTEMSLINVLTGELIYTKHFPEGYTQIKPKEWKILAAYF